MLNRAKIIITLSGILLLSLIVSCGKPPSGAAPTNTGVSLSVTITPKASAMVQATGTVTATLVDLGGLAEGTPVPDWKSIPLMPGAIAGSEKNGNYLYTVTAVPAEVNAYYARELTKLGWVARPGTGTPEASGIVTLVFSKGQDICQIGIFPQKTGTLVMLGKSKK